MRKKFARFVRRYILAVVVVSIGIGILIDRVFVASSEPTRLETAGQVTLPPASQPQLNVVSRASANEAVQAYNGQRQPLSPNAQRPVQAFGAQPGGGYANSGRAAAVNTAPPGVPSGFAPAMQLSAEAAAQSVPRGHQTFNRQPTGSHTGSALPRSQTISSAGGQFWGTPLQERPKHFLFGYGSLMNSKSRGATSGKVTAAVPVRISAEFGYVREWNFRSPTSKLTALGIRRRGPGEAGSTINGVVYPVEGGSIEKFDEREEGYKRVLVPREMIQAVGWMALPAEGQIWVYVPEGPTGEAGVGLPLPDAFYPVLQSYIDICVTGAMEYGEDFAREFLETTFGWGPFWLNDRELPRRPWVHQKAYKKVDALLAKFPADPRRNSLHLRRLPTEYSMHFTGQPAWR